MTIRSPFYIGGIKGNKLDETNGSAEESTAVVFGYLIKMYDNSLYVQHLKKRRYGINFDASWIKLRM